MVGDSYSDFVHKLEFEVSKGRITQVLHQVSAILWLLAPGQAFGWLIIRQSSPVHHFPASQCLKNATLTAKCCATVDSRRSSPHVHKIAFVWGSQILNKLENMILLLRPRTSRSKSDESMSSKEISSLIPWRYRETNPEMQQPSSAVGDPSRWGPKARFISFQKEVHVCRLLL